MTRFMSRWKHRRRSYAGIMLALVTSLTAAWTAAAAPADRPTREQRLPAVGEFTHEGTVVKAGKGQLAMSIDGGLRHVHRVSPKADISLDGEPAKLEDLQAGDHIEVVSQVVVRPTRSGRVLSIDGPALEIKATRPQQPAEQQQAGGADKDVALGIAVAPSPGGSPLVMAVVENSPAAEAGLRRGDYITAVNEKKIKSPAALQKVVDQLNPGDTATLDVWRGGQDQSLEVRFPAAGADDSPKLAGEPWLGLMLETADETPGALIARVYVRSPAAKAGLAAGDRIVEINGETIESPRDAAAQVQQLSPGAEADIAILREGTKERFTVQVGNLGDFHERLFGSNFRERFEDFHRLFDPDFDGVPERFELMKPALPPDQQQQ